MVNPGVTYYFVFLLVQRGVHGPCQDELADGSANLLPQTAF
jgi:hypothetical protein